MKFLVHANGPHVSTGYGVQCAQLVERLKAHGHDVAVSCTYGQQGASGSWRGITLYPGGYEVNGNDVIHGHANHHFGGDELGGWIITIMDVWALVNPLLADYNVAAWCPVDHLPAPPDVLKFFHRTGATPIAMSRFGESLLFDAGLDPVYIPLSVDTNVMRPTPTVEVNGQTVTARQLLDIPGDAFVVGMVAMNKGWARDRKGFNEAMRAFGLFWQRHPNAVLYLHTEKFGAAEGVNLVELSQHCAVPEHAIRWVDQYAYRLGIPPQMMAATYTAMDVLLAPSHGEGFCVPLIEAQACGTPVVATDFSAQAELVGPESGWKVGGQPEWDPAQHSSYLCPSIGEIVNGLEAAYRADLAGMQAAAREFAVQYDTDRVFDEFWLPFLTTLEDPGEPHVAYDRSPMPDADAVAVIVPAMRPDNVAQLRDSFDATNDGSARLVVVEDEPGAVTSFAEKVNRGYAETSEPWLLLVGDDVVFHQGWVEAARKLSDRYDIIGTNDTAGSVKNPDVAAGRHADHFFVRRAYVDTVGGCLDGPGVLAPDAYRHWFCDREMIQLAKARGVFTPCLDSIVEHLHPAYDGREDLRLADPVYMAAREHSDDDRRIFQSRLPLIEMQRTTRGKRR